MIVGAADKVNLSKGWSDFWKGLTGSNANIDGILSLATAIGALLVVGAILKWLWEKRRGGGGGGGGGKTDGIIWALALGAVLAAPNLLIPIFLNILDVVANGVANVFKSTSGT